jgi:hypothetical protein
MLPIQSKPINRSAQSEAPSVGSGARPGRLPLDGSNGVRPLFYCPFGCGVVNCGQGRYCVNTGFMSCDCIVG